MTTHRRIHGQTGWALTVTTAASAAAFNPCWIEVDGASQWGGGLRCTNPRHASVLLFSGSHFFPEFNCVLRHILFKSCPFNGATEWHFDIFAVWLE